MRDRRDRSRGYIGTYPSILFGSIAPAVGTFLLTMVIFNDASPRR
jgi:hypothetical protein